MATAYDGHLQQSWTLSHSVLSSFDPCVVRYTLPTMTKGRVTRPKISKAVNADEDYRPGAIVKFGTLKTLCVYDVDEDYKALLNESNNGTMTITASKKDQDNTTAGTVVFSDCFPIGIGEATIDYFNETEQVLIEIEWSCSGYSRTLEAV